MASLQDHTAVTGAYPRAADFDASPDDKSDARAHQAEQLINLAHGRREPLERLRSDYLRLLHADSADLAATEALRVVEAALRMIPRPAGNYAWQRRWSTPKQQSGVG